MELAQALSFVRPRRDGVLLTIKGDGRPQASNILYSATEDDRVEISVTDDRAKTGNLRRDPRASLYVPGDDFWHYVVVEAAAELSPVAATPEDQTVDSLVAQYRRAGGEHPDWAEFRAAMVAQRRLLLTLVPQRAYGLLTT